MNLTYIATYVLTYFNTKKGKKWRVERNASGQKILNYAENINYMFIKMNEWEEYLYSNNFLYMYAEK